LRVRIDLCTLGLALLIALVWLSHVSFASRTEVPNLDASWHEVLGHELAHHWRAGVDTVFTYGPLGYFYPGVYARGLFWAQAIAWELAFRLVLTAVLVLGVRRVSGAIEKTLFVLTLLFLFAGQDA